MAISNVAFLCRNDGQQGHVEVRDEPDRINSQNGVYSDAAWCNNCLLYGYRQPESIASVSSPSSGGHSPDSPLSSSVSSPADSTGKSDSDTESELSGAGSSLCIGYVSSSNVSTCCSQYINDRSQFNLVTSSPVCNQPCYPSALVSDTLKCFNMPHLAIGPQLVHPPHSLITVQSVEPPNPPVSGQSATTVWPTELDRCSTHSSISVYPTQPLNNLPQLQSPNCLQAPQHTSCFPLARPTISLQPTQPAKGPHLTQPVRSTQQAQQAVITRSGVQPGPHQASIRRGPVAPKTVAVSARERIAAKLNKAMKDCVVMKLAKLTDDQLSKGDEHGDT